MRGLGVSSIISYNVVRMLDHLRASFTESDLRGRLNGRREDARPPSLRGARRADRASIATLWAEMRERGTTTVEDERILADPDTLDAAEAYGANIENMIGTVKVPIGVVGPLRINGLNANGDFVVPLATTEAALVASYARGAEIASRSGGVSAAMLNEGVLRSPGFKFSDLVDAGLFIDWVARSSDDLKAAAEATTRYGKLVSLEPVMDYDIVFLLCRYTTGDASGQNMVTIATDALCRHIEAHCPVRPQHWFIEANFSGDKKSTYLGLMTGRGRKVTASVTIPRALVEQGLHVSVERMLDYAQMANLGAMLSGQLGAQGHYANGLAAFYLATGQDAACVSESAIGFTRMERRGEDLFVSVTLPNVLVGSVGGGTGLPSQSAGLRLLGLKGNGKAAALAEVAAALCLCGEISIIGAIAAGHFTRAHRKLARDR
jgi:hydroxymethylglutaryl-CoA reductase (NADPH)